jgi:transposase
MSFLTAQICGKQMYVFLVNSYRNDEKKPTNKRISVGKISKETFKPIYKDKFLADFEAGKSSISQEKFDEFNNKDFKSIMLEKNIIDKKVNNAIDNSLVANSIIISEKNKIILNDEIFDSLRDWGTPYFFTQIANNIGLMDILKSIFGELFADIIISIAIYLAVSKKELIYYNYWLETIDININKSLSSQRISEILSNISFSQRNMFYTKWYDLVKDDENVALSITSLTNYSNELVIRYSNDDKKLPQIKLCMLFSQSCELPLYQSIYYGSLTDVSTLFCMINELISISDGIKYIITLDKCFFCESNIDILVKENVGNGFLIDVPFSSNLAASLVNKYRNIHQNQKLLVHSSGNNLYGITENIIYGPKKTNLFAHIFYNDIKYTNEKQKLINDLTKLQNLLIEGKKINNLKKDQIVKYFDIDILNGKINPTINNLIFEETLKFAGWQILFSNSIEDINEANKIYRNKYIIDKSFNSLKNRLSLNIISIHNSERMENKLFISFIYLILTSFINKQFRDNGIYNSDAIDEIYEKIQLMKKTNINSNIIYKSITEEVKNIFKVCKVSIPTFDINKNN